MRLSFWQSSTSRVWIACFGSVSQSPFLKILHLDSQPHCCQDVKPKRPRLDNTLKVWTPRDGVEWWSHETFEEYHECWLFCTQDLFIRMEWNHQSTSQWKMMNHENHEIDATNLAHEVFALCCIPWSSSALVININRLTIGFRVHVFDFLVFSPWSGFGFHIGMQVAGRPFQKSFKLQTFSCWSS